MFKIDNYLDDGFKGFVIVFTSIVTIPLIIFFFPFYLIYQIVKYFGYQLVKIDG